MPMKRGTIDPLGQHISFLISGVHLVQHNRLVIDVVTNPVKFYINMLGTLMMHRVKGKIFSTLVVLDLRPMDESNDA